MALNLKSYHYPYPYVNDSKTTMTVFEKGVTWKKIDKQGTMLDVGSWKGGMKKCIV